MFFIGSGRAVTSFSNVMSAAGKTAYVISDATVPGDRTSGRRYRPVPRSDACRKFPDVCRCRFSESSLSFCKAARR